MESIGKATHTGICAHCGNPIVFIEWDGMIESGWSHDLPAEDGVGRMGRHCPGQYVAEPLGESTTNSPNV